MSFNKKITLSICYISMLFSSEFNLNKFKECAKIDNNDSRLKCYDSFTKKINSTNNYSENNNSKKSIGKWKEFIDTDPLTDKKIVTLRLDANNEIIGNFNFESSRPALIIRCQNNKTDSYIAWDLYFPSFHRPR